jgi:RHS repeat-associated protein
LLEIANPETAIIVQEAHRRRAVCYGFGLGMAGLDFNAPGSAEHRYTYNGKEEVPDFGLGWLDYGARHYQPDIGRWGGVDPLAHKRDWLTPYNFVQNSPLWRIDPDGAFDFVLNGQGNVYWDKNANSQATTKAGEKYLGKTLTFVFNSYIDGKLSTVVGVSAAHQQQGPSEVRVENLSSQEAWTGRPRLIGGRSPEKTTAHFLAYL